MPAPEANAHEPLAWPLTSSAGLLMGAADAVPGVSGGTIALVVGVYERLIDSLSTVVRFPWHVRTPDGRARIRAALRFLVPLGLGILVAWLAATRLLVGPTEHKGWLRRADTAPLCYAFFFGLVLFSLREPWRRIRSHDAGCIVAALIGAAVVAWSVGLEHATRPPEDWMLIYGGALAVTVMLLPGISGSLLLLVIGQYTTVTGAVHDGEIGRLLVFLAGVALGLALFVPFLRHLLRTRHDVTLAVLTGLMAGSLRALWPWKSHYDVKDLDRGLMSNVAVGDNWPWVLLFVALGAASVWLLHRLEQRIEQAG